MKRDAVTPRRIKIYKTLRTAHLERIDPSRGEVVLYLERSYDFDAVLAREHGAARFSALRFLWVLRSHARSGRVLLEVNEPLFLASWPLQVRVQFLRALAPQRRQVRVATYAIENGDTASFLSSKTRLPKNLCRALVRGLGGYLYRRADLVEFGTEAARENYRTTLGPQFNRVPNILVEALPTRADQLSSRDPGRVVYVGSLERRKGLLQVLEAMRLLASEHDNVTLHVLGRGPLAGEVSEVARSAPWLRFTHEPTRSQINEELALAKVLVLLSQREPAWREQIGLPILEGLSHGIEIVASTETGIGQWLASAGHAVLEPDEPPRRVADAIYRHLSASRTADDVVAMLPAVDSRQEVDLRLEDVGGWT